MIFSFLSPRGGCGPKGNENNKAFKKYIISPKDALVAIIAVADT